MGYNLGMDPEDLLITVAQAESEHRGWRLAVRGELDLDTSAKLADHVQLLLDRGAILIVLDLTDASFIDSSGLRTLVHAGQLLEDAGGRLLIEGMSPAAEKLFELTGLLERNRDWTATRRDEPT